MNDHRIVKHSNLIDRARTQGTPLTDGEIATFIWLGERAPQLIGDFTGWEDGDPAILAKVEPGIWTYQLALPADAYMEYVFFDGETRVEDPLNRHLASNGMGKYNHYFYMPNGKPTPLAEPQRGEPQGKLTQLVIQPSRFLAGELRPVTFYQPPTSDPLPLIIVWDGNDYLRRTRLTTIVDRLIATGRINPVALALIDNGGAARSLEYACNEGTLEMLVSELIPFAQNNLNLLDYKTNPGAYGIVGASMGGLMAFYTGMRLPHIFGKVLSQSGAFSFGDFESVVFDLVRWGDIRPIRLWMDVGVYDIPALLLANRRLNSLLESRGYPVVYREFNAGHNYPAWRDEVWRGLEYLFKPGSV
jgi:enterochelin esterase-like enzyme